MPYLNVEESAIGVIYNVNGNVNQNKINEYPKLEDVEHIIPKLPKSIDILLGREQDISDLDDLFRKKNYKIVTLCGLPGMGKTELAKHFAKRWVDTNKINRVCWIQATTEEDIRKCFDHLRKIFEIPNILDTKAIINIIMDIFKGSNTLFIFDNAENRQSIKEFETPEGCFTLITSQEKDWGDDIKSVELQPLTPEDALKILKLKLNPPHSPESSFNEQLMILVKLLDCIPLALQLAAAYIRQEMKNLGDEFCLDEYIEELEDLQNLVDYSAPSSSSLQYEKSIANAIDISLQKIKKKKSDTTLAIDILNICAYLNPFILYEDTILNIPYLKQELNKTKQKKDVRRALSLLDNYSLISYDQLDNSVWLHGLVQKVLQFFQDKDMKIKRKYYRESLEYVFSSDTVHRVSVLQYADKNTNFFIEFYNDNKPKLTSAKNYIQTRNSDSLEQSFKNFSKMLVSFLAVLVCTNSKICLQYIFRDLGEKARSRIDGYMLLYVAILWNRPKMLKLLIEYGANVNMKLANGSTFLYLAAIGLKLECLKILLGNGADVNELHCNGRPVITRVMAEALKSNKIESPIFSEIISAMINSGAKIDNMGEYKSTLLHYSALSGSAKLTELVMDVSNIDVNIQNNMGLTPFDLVIAVRKSKEMLSEGSKIHTDHLDVLRVLIRRGATIQEVSNMSILYWAVACRDMKLMQFIIDELNVDVNIKNSGNGLTPVFGIFIGNSENIFEVKCILKELIKRNADICNDGGDTILHWAVHFKNVDLMKFIIDELNIDVNLRNYKGNTPLHSIIMKENSSVINSEISLAWSDIERTIQVIDCLLRRGALPDLMNYRLESSQDLLQQYKGYFSSSVS